MTYGKILATGNESARKLLLTAETKNGKAYIRIVGRISDWNSNNSKDFQNKVDELVKAHAECEVYINSQGGSVLEANEINNQLKRFDKVTVTVGALAASAATYFIACYPTTVSMNTQIMIHKPMLGVYGNEDEITANLKLLKNVTKDYLAKYSKKTGKTVAEIEELWKTGDYWMNASEAKADGFVDFISDETEASITPEDVTMLEACGAPIVPKVTDDGQDPNKKNISKTRYIMDREELIAFLGLDANATDQEIETAKSKMKVDALKQRSQEQSNKDKEQTELDAKAEKLVDDAIKAKKLTADQKETYVDLAKANYEATEKAIKAMTEKPKLSGQLKPGEEAEDASRAKWTLQDYLDKDPDAYEKMLTDNPEKAKELEADYFGK